MAVILSTRITSPHRLLTHTRAMSSKNTPYEVEATGFFHLPLIATDDLVMHKFATASVRFFVSKGQVRMRVDWREVPAYWLEAVLSDGGAGLITGGRVVPGGEKHEWVVAPIDFKAGHLHISSGSNFDLQMTLPPDVLAALR